MYEYLENNNYNNSCIKIRAMQNVTSFNMNFVCSLGMCVIKMHSWSENGDMIKRDVTEIEMGGCL